MWGSFPSAEQFLRQAVVQTVQPQDDQPLDPAPRPAKPEHGLRQQAERPG